VDSVIGQVGVALCYEVRAPVGFLAFLIDAVRKDRVGAGLRPVRDDIADFQLIRRFGADDYDRVGVKRRVHAARQDLIRGEAEKRSGARPVRAREEQQERQRDDQQDRKVDNDYQQRVRYFLKYTQQIQTSAVCIGSQRPEAGGRIRDCGRHPGTDPGA